MREGFGSVVMMAAEATQKMGTPRPLHIALSLSMGVLVALVAGFLHRSDRPVPFSPRYSVPAAVMRAGIALLGTASLILAALMSPQQGISFLVLVLSAVVGAVYGLLAFYDSSTIQAALWRGATATAAAGALGQTFVALYIAG